MKLRVYQYKCLRCEVVYEEDGYPAKMVKRHIQIISLEDENEEKRLEEEYPDDYMGKSQLGSYHACGDGGYGIGQLIGCSKEYEIY